ITPDDGYYVDEVLFNGTPYGVYSQLGVVTLRTPEITENSTLEVKFEKKEEALAPDIETVPYMAKYVDEDGSNATFLMGRINTLDFDVTEYGVLYSTLNPYPTYNGFNVKKAPSKYPCSDAGYYGFTFKNPNNRENIYVRAYAVYNDGEVVLSDKTINLVEFKIDDITATYNNTTPVLNDDVYVDRIYPSVNYNSSGNHKLMLPGGYDSTKYGRVLYLEFDISGLEGISSGAELQLYAASSGVDTVKYLSIYALENEFDETTLTYSIAENFGKCLGTLKVPDGSGYQPIRFDITEYLREHIKTGKQYMSIGVGIDEDWQKQIYPNGHPVTKQNFYVNVKDKIDSNGPQIILY
ncbi:MAG: DNRLRE domain-containing protein, partial [Ruminococcaceae bacterium]|nr:DNRLRE domain-containing protein [Oscillospiraceae bacterium]